MTILTLAENVRNKGYAEILLYRKKLYTSICICLAIPTALSYILISAICGWDDAIGLLAILAFVSMTLLYNYFSTLHRMKKGAFGNDLNELQEVIRFAHRTI